MRTFIALEVPDGFRAETGAVARRLAQVCAGRFMPFETYHVTLAFIGDVGEPQARDAIAALEAACAGAAPCELTPEGLGKFGRPQDATLWLGLSPAPELTDLAARVRGELSARDLPFDDKPFRPHVTLGRRVRLPRGELPPLAFPTPVRAARVTLFKSTLGPDGASYKPLHSVVLGE